MTDLIKNATEFCQLVETKLGWCPPAGPYFRRYQSMAKRVNERIAVLDQGRTVPLYTWHNLHLAIELCWRERRPCNPLGVLRYVERAVDMTAPTESELWQRVVGAIHDERAIGDPDGWAVRLTRAQGDYQREVLDEWVKARRAS